MLHEPYRCEPVELSLAAGMVTHRGRSRNRLRSAAVTQFSPENGYDARVSEAVTRRVYRQPPIVEAVCELRFVGSDEPDPTLAGRILDRLGDAYSGRPKEQRVLRAPDKVVPGTIQELVQESRVQFLDVTGRRIASVGHNVLSVSDLKPYSGWESFRPRIEAAIVVYESLAKPTAVSRIGLRYINVMSDSIVRLAEAQEYFTISAQLPPNLDAAVRGFTSRMETELVNGDALMLTFANAVQSDGEKAFVLDIDISRSFESGEPLVGVMSCIDELRLAERAVFEQCITDKTRELFDR